MNFLDTKSPVSLSGSKSGNTNMSGNDSFSTIGCLIGIIISVMT